MTRYTITDWPHRHTTTSAHEAAVASRNGARVTATAE